MKTNRLLEIKRFYEEVFALFDKTPKIRYIDVRFYPYVGINHTIRIRDGIVFIRISDLCREMPDAGQKALAFILVSKLLRKRVPSQANEIYSRFISNEEIRGKASENRRARGRKVIGSSKGAAYDLDEMFEQINEAYFKNTIEKPVLTWSPRKTYHRLGHYSSDHHTIMISKSLDDAKVPKYVAEFVLFHEMLHIHHPTQHKNGRRYMHTPSFRRDEKKFLHYEKAEKWIDKNIHVLKKNAQRQDWLW